MNTHTVNSEMEMSDSDMHPYISDPDTDTDTDTDDAHDPEPVTATASREPSVITIHMTPIDDQDEMQRTTHQYYQQQQHQHQHQQQLLSLPSSSITSARSLSSAPAATPSWLDELRSSWQEQHETIHSVPTRRIRHVDVTPTNTATATATATSSTTGRRTELQSDEDVDADAGGEFENVEFEFTELEGDEVEHQRPGPAAKRFPPALAVECSKLLAFKFYRVCTQINSMFKPVTGMVVLMTIYMHLLAKPAAQQNRHVWRKILLYTEPSGSSFASVLAGSFLNGVIVLAAVLFLTLIFVIFLITTHKQPWIMRRAIQCVIAVTLTVPWSYFIYLFIVLYDVHLDILSYLLLAWNFSILGCHAIFNLSNTHNPLNKFYLLAMSLAITWPFTEFPEWSVWCTLIVLGVYDICAVLTPWGPLRYIMKLEDELNHKEPLPGLMYRGHFFMLGLGDLVFYAVLSARAAVTDWMTLITVTIAILMGVAFTIMLTYRYDSRALPALPLSILFGLIFYACTPILIVPFVQHMGVRQLII